jgi:NAD(P)H-dependent FMN reductase
MNLLVFAASHRGQSVNRKLAAIAAGIAEAQGHIVDFPEYGEFDMPIYDDETARSSPFPEAAKDFVSRLVKSQGVIIASPEYNWSFPGSLKNIIDWASIATPNPFAGKTALLLSASTSLRGGAQGLVHLKLPLESLEMFVYPRIFTLGRAQEAFTGEGGFKDMKLQQELEQLVIQFIATAAALSVSLV